MYILQEDPVLPVAEQRTGFRSPQGHVLPVAGTHTGFRSSFDCTSLPGFHTPEISDPGSYFK